MKRNKKMDNIDTYTLGYQHLTRGQKRLIENLKSKYLPFFGTLLF